MYTVSSIKLKFISLTTLLPRLINLMFLGCGLGRYGGQCTECLGCSTCDIESGKCGMYYLF